MSTESSLESKGIPAGSAVVVTVVVLSGVGSLVVMVSIRVCGSIVVFVLESVLGTVSDPALWLSCGASCPRVVYVVKIESVVLRAIPAKTHPPPTPARPPVDPDTVVIVPDRGKGR